MTTVNMVYPTTAMHGGIVSVTTDESKGDSFPDNLDTVMVDWPGTLTMEPMGDVTKRLEIVRTGILSSTSLRWLCDELHLYADSIDKCSPYNGGGYKQLKSAVVGGYRGSLTDISGGSFLSGCTSLTSLTLPDSLTTISGGYFLSGCTSLTSLTLPDSLTTISGGYFLQGCTSLTSLTLPDSLTTISGGYFLQGCTSLTSLTLPSRMDRISGSFLKGCTGLRTLVMPASVDSFDTGGLLDGVKNTVTDLTLPMTLMQSASVWRGHLAEGATVRVPASLVSTYKADTTWAKFTITAIA